MQFISFLTVDILFSCDGTQFNLDHLFKKKMKKKIAAAKTTTTKNRQKVVEYFSGICGQFKPNAIYWCCAVSMCTAQQVKM